MNEIRDFRPCDKDLEEIREMFKPEGQYYGKYDGIRSWDEEKKKFGLSDEMMRKIYSKNNNLYLLNKIKNKINKNNGHW